MTYVPDGTREYVPGARLEIERRSPEGRASGEITLEYVVCQREDSSPHELSWESQRFDEVEAARRFKLELELRAALILGTEPLSEIPGLTELAFARHWQGASGLLGGHHDTGKRSSLGECPTCYKEVEDLVWDAVEGLQILNSLRLLQIVTPLP